MYRVPDERKPKQAMEMRREGRTGRGRPRIKWENTIEGMEERENNDGNKKNV